MIKRQVLFLSAVLFLITPKASCQSDQLKDKLQNPVFDTMIIEEGSTNGPGLKITIPPTGIAILEETKRVRSKTKVIENPAPGGSGVNITHAGKEAQKTRKLPKKLLDKLRLDVSAAMPLSRLPVDCQSIKSVSFDSRRFISVGEERSPDLDYPKQSDERIIRLNKDIQEVKDVFKR